MLGIALVTSANAGMLTGQIAGQGSLAPLHGAAPEAGEARWEQGMVTHAGAGASAADDMQMLLLMGMVLVLIGFGLHAWMTLRDTRTVPVHAAKKPPARERIARTNARKMEVFYVEEVIRM